MIIDTSKIPPSKDIREILEMIGKVGNEIARIQFEVHNNEKTRRMEGLNIYLLQAYKNIENAYNILKTKINEEENRKFWEDIINEV